MLRALLLSSCLSLPGLALAAEAPSISDIDELIVTAQKRAEPLGEVPVSMAALSAEAISALGIRQPADLGKAIPGFVFTASAYDAPVFSLRGVGFFNEALGAPPTVSVYQDEVPLPFSAMTEGAALDVDRIEVLKGPQGALFGQNATGGAVNFIPAQPTRSPSSGADLTYGRFDDREAGGFVSGPLGRDLQARLAFRTERRDGFRRNDPLVSGDAGANGQRDFSTARLLADWEPSDEAKLRLNLNGWIDRSDTQAKQKIGYAPLTPLAAGGYPGSLGYPNLQQALADYPVASSDSRIAGFDPGVSLRRNDRFGQAAIRGAYQTAGGVALTTITSFSHLDVWRPNDIDGTTYPDIFITVDGRIDSFSQELRLSGGDAQPFAWMFGANYQQDDVHDVQQIRMNGTNSGFGDIRFQRLANINDQRVGTGAVFGSLEVMLPGQLRARSALRYTARRDRFGGCLADPGGPGGIRDGFAALSSSLSGSTVAIAPGACVTLGADNKPVDSVRKTLDEDNTSYSFSLSRRFGAGGLVFGSMTRGYKAGAFDTLPSIRPSQIDPVKQERLTAYEAGWRGAAPDWRIDADASVFHYDYRDKQVAGYVDTGAPFGLLPALVSIPRSKVFGVEASVDWRPSSNLRLRAGASYLETRVSGHFITSAPLGGSVDIGGERFPNAPKWQASADGEYGFPVGVMLHAYLGAALSYRSASTAAFGGGPLFAVDASTPIDLRIGIESARTGWKVEVWGKNVLNVYYWTSVEHVEDTVTRLAGMPATWGLTVSVRR